MFDAPNKDTLAELTALENKFHANKPEKTKTGYGKPSDGIFAKRPKMSEKITITVIG